MHSLLDRCGQALLSLLFRSRKAPLLEQFRRRLRHAWLLHVWLISALLLLPVGRLARADEDVFEYTRSESSVSVTVSAPDGTTGMTRGSSRPVTVNVQQNTWEVWTGVPHGATRIQNYQTMPMGYTGLTFSATEDGLVSNASLSTDANANASATFTMGTKASGVTVTEGSTGASGSITFGTPEDTWNFDHCETLLSASLSADGTTDGLLGGTGRQVQAHVDYSWWYIYVSDLDPARTKVESYNIGPAQYAAVTWSVPNGDGTLTSQAGSTDYAGNATASFTMGSAASTVRADVAYATGDSTYATLGFSPYVTVWTHDHDETTITTTLSTRDAVTRLEPGSSKWVTAQVLYNTLEVWHDDLGNWQSRNPTSGAASGAQVSFYIDQGDGTISDGNGHGNPTLTADADGLATVLFIMGSQDSRVVANASYSMASSIGSLDFTLDSWWLDHSESAVDLLLSADLSTVTATVSLITWDVFTNGTSLRTRNRSSSPAGNAQVDFRADHGANVADTDPETGILTAFTGLDGTTSTAYTSGTDAEAVISATAYFRDKSMSAEIHVMKDTDGDGIPDLVELAYGLNPDDASDGSSAHTVNGQTDGVTWSQAYNGGTMDSLAAAPPSGNSDEKSVAEGSDLDITLSAGGGQGSLSFGISSQDGNLSNYGTLGSVSKSGSSTATVNFTSKDEVEGSTWFQFTVTDACGRSSTGTVGIKVVAAAITFEIRGDGAENHGGAFTEEYKTKTRTGSWDTSGLSADKTLNTVAPPWSGWSETVTDDGRKEFGYGVPYEPNTSLYQTFRTTPLSGEWLQAEGTVDVGSALELMSVTQGTVVTVPYSVSDTSYPYSEMDEFGNTIYLFPSNSNGLSDTQMETFGYGGPIYNWHAEKMDLRMVCRDGGTHTRSITRTLNAIDVEDGVETPSTVTFTLAPGETESAVQSFVECVYPDLVDDDSSEASAAAGSKGKHPPKSHGKKIDLPTGRALPVVKIKTISFGGDKYWALKSDLGVEYKAPQFDATESTSKSYPVAFTSGSKPQLAITISVPDPDHQLITTPYVEAILPDGMKLAEQQMQNGSNDDEYKIEDLSEVTGKLAAKIQFWNAGSDHSNGAKAFDIRWSFYLKDTNGKRRSLGDPITTSHTVYVTRSDPKSDVERFETLFNVACRNANGIANSADEKTVVKAIFSDFTDLVVSSVQPGSGDRKTDSTGQPEALIYWKSVNDPSTLAKLLSGGTGKCGAFAHFLADALRSQGMDANYTVLKPPKPPEAKIYEAWKAKKTGLPQPDHAPVFFIPKWDVTDPNNPSEISGGTKAQGNKTPAGQVFSDHAVVEIGGEYYDPSYGTGPFKNPDEWASKSVQNYGEAWYYQNFLTIKVKYEYWVWK